MDLQELNKKKKEAKSKINAIVEDLLSDIEIDRCIVNVDITRRYPHLDNKIMDVKTEIKIVL